MNFKELEGKKIGILGLGPNNIEVTAYLAKEGLDVTIRDRNEAVQANFTKIKGEFSNLKWQIQKDILKNIDQFDIVLRSPSISYLTPALQKARRQGIEVTSQTKLFLDKCPAYVIGVTGTKGKGTTATLLSQYLEAGYSKGKTYLAGNIGQDPFGFIDQLKPDDIVILELSSFQLEDLTTSPDMAILLNITPDHLDRHYSFGEYQAAKIHILAHQKDEDIAIVFGDNPDIARMAKYSEGQHYIYHVDQPQRNSVWAGEADGREILYIQIDEEIESIDITDRKILGKHHLENIIPATLAATLLDVPASVIKPVLLSFTGLPHRLTYVGEFGGYNFYDDSIATTPEAVMAALKVFKGQRIHLICGGKDKGVDYSELVDLALKSCITISLLPGTTEKTLAKQIKNSVKTTDTKVKVLDNTKDPVMDTILSGIIPHLQKDDIVLLSPSCASDTPYANYKERGDDFVRAVKARFK